MKIQLQPSRPNGAFTYVTVVITMIVVGLMLAAYLKLVAVQNNLTARSQTWNRTVPVIEAGIEEALAHMNKNGSPDSSGNFNMANLTGDGWTSPVGSTTGPWTKLGGLDGDYYLVQIDRWTGNTTNFPFISSTGYVKQVEAFSLNRSFGPFVADILDDLSSSGRYSRRVVQCSTTNIPTFTKALVAKHGIDMNGNGVFTDSFDSDNSAYSTNKRWDVNKHRDHGDIASNDTVTNAISVQNANVWGRVSTGPFGTVSVGSQGAVGDAAWQNGGNHGIKPGFSTDDMNMEIPDVIIPSVTWSAMPSGGSGYQYIFNTANGNYRLSAGGGNIGGKILVSAPNVQLWVQSGWSFNGQDSLTIASNASIKIYLDCSSADIQGQGIINNSAGGFSTADQCYIFGTSALTSLDMGGNGESTCALYVPYANVTFHGGGSSDQDFSGAAVVNSIKLSGHYSFHYDEALGRRGLWHGFVVTSWNEK